MRQLNFARQPTEDIELCWRRADDLTIDSRRAIYLWRRQGTREILYIGKAYKQSLKSRWNCPSKKRLDRLAKREKVVIRPLIASVFTKQAKTSHLFDDIERLLIFLVQPRWNVTLKSSCTLQHHTLIVKCSGDWSYPRTEFRYCNDLPHALFIASE